MTFSDAVDDELLKDAAVRELRSLAVATARFWEALKDCERSCGKDIEYNDDLVGMLAGDVGTAADPFDATALSDANLIEALDDACQIEE